MIQQQAQDRTAIAKQLSNAPPGMGTFQHYLSIIYFQRVEFFWIFSEVLWMPRIASFLLIQIQEVFNSIFFWWHLLQLVTPNYSAHATPRSEHPVSREVKREKRTDMRYSGSISQSKCNWSCNNHATACESSICIPLILWKTFPISDSRRATEEPPQSICPRTGFKKKCPVLTHQTSSPEDKCVHSRNREDNISSVLTFCKYNSPDCWGHTFEKQMPCIFKPVTQSPRVQIFRKIK